MAHACQHDSASSSRRLALPDAAPTVLRSCVPWALAYFSHQRATDSISLSLTRDGFQIFRPAYGVYESAGVSVRSMNYLCFCNTKLVFKVMRYDAQLIDTSMHVPVTVHIN